MEQIVCGKERVRGEIERGREREWTKRRNAPVVKKITREAPL